MKLALGEPLPAPACPDATGQARLPTARASQPGMQMHSHGMKHRSDT